MTTDTRPECLGCLRERLTAAGATGRLRPGGTSGQCGRCGADTSGWEMAE